MPEEQHAAGVQPLVEGVDHPTARRLVEVDEHVPAEDDIEGSERPVVLVLDQVEVLELDHPAEFGLDLEGVALLGIEVLAKLLRPFGLEIPALLRDPSTAPYAIVAMRVWRTTGYYAIIYLAGLQAISPELKEAARLDGASELRVVRHVVLPGLKPVALFCIVLSTVSGLEMFDEPMILTQGGPGDSTLTVVMFVYQQGFQFLQLGYAAAASYALTVLIVVVSLVQRFALRERGR